MNLLLVKQKQSRLLIALVVIAITIVGFPGPSGAAAPTPPSANSSLAVPDIAEASIPKVVWISCTYEAEPRSFFFGNPSDSTPSKGIGSGFFIDSTGQILTNAHVVAGAQMIEVTLNGQTKPLTAKLIGTDRDLDLAIIKIETLSKTPFFKLGDSDRIRIGETVLAIGNPYGLDHTVTQGIISAKGRPLTAGERFGEHQNYENMLQTDAAINPGNSGGPLLNLQGEVIGINAVVNANGQGLGFAIPINSVKAVLTELQTTGKVSRPWLGAYLTDVKVLDAKTRSYLGIEGSNGVLIKPIKNSPAERADLRLHDVILEINHQPITSGSELISYIRQQKIGTKVTLLILRNRNLLTVELVLEEKP